MFIVRTTTGLVGNSCTLDGALGVIWQHLTTVPQDGQVVHGTVGWTIATYGDRVWSGRLEVPVEQREQSIGEQLDHINARLVLSHLAGASEFVQQSRLHSPVGTPADDIRRHGAGAVG